MRKPFYPESEISDISTIHKRKSNYTNTTNEKDEKDILNIFQNVKSNKGISKKILCLCQSSVLNERFIGVAKTEISLSFTTKVVISSGEYPYTAIESFILFISEFQPDIIFMHTPNAVSCQLRDLIEDSTVWAGKCHVIPNNNIKNSTMNQLFIDYFQKYQGWNHVYAYSKVNEILAPLSPNAQSAWYTVFSLALKAWSTSNSNAQNEIHFERLHFHDWVFVTPKTQSELKIFVEKWHPSIVKGKGKSKEGLSLYNIFNKCATVQGQKLLKNMFTFPLKNEDKIRERYDCVDSLVKMANYSFVKSWSIELGKIKDWVNWLEEIKRFWISEKVWVNMIDSLNAVYRLLQVYKSKTTPIPLLDKLFKKINFDNITTVHQFINNCCEITRDQRPKIKKGVNSLLDEECGKYEKWNEILTKLAEKYASVIPENCFMTKYLFVFIPQLGYMFGVEKNKEYYVMLKKEWRKWNNNNNTDVDVEGEGDGDGEGLTAERFSVTTHKKSRNVNGNGNGNWNMENSNITDSSDNDCYIVNTSTHGNMNSNKTMTQIQEVEEDIITQNQTILDANKHETPRDNTRLDKVAELSQSDDDNEIDDNDIPNKTETFILQHLNIPGLDISYQFHTSEMIYFKNAQTSELDLKYGDLAARITDFENAIFREISNNILLYSDDIHNTNAFVASVDVFINLFTLCSKYNLGQPLLHSQIAISMQEQALSSSCLSFVEGRNIITEISSENKLIKNSFKAGHHNIFIISGAISSGKSVFLRLVGLLVYLAQIGIYTPAKQFCYEVYTKILTNIEIYESYLDQMSGFTIEIKEIKSIIDQVTRDFGVGDNDENLLILLDEPYKRSSFHNQNCLWGGTIRHWCDWISNVKSTMGSNKKMTVFISISNESLDFLQKNQLINEDIIGVYSMRSSRVSEGNVINLYEIEHLNISGRKPDVKESDINRWFIAKNNGLDNNWFMKSLEIFKNISMNTPIFPNVGIVEKLLVNMRNRKEMIWSHLQDYFRNIVIHKNAEMGNEEYKLCNLIYDRLTS